MHKAYRRLTAGFLAAAAIFASACSDSAARQAAADSLAALGAELEQARDELQQRDALMGELAQTTRLVNQIDSSLSAVSGIAAAQARAQRTGGASSDPWTARHDSLQAKVEGVIQLLEQSRSRVAGLTRNNREMESRLQGYVSTIEELQATVERQKGEISALGIMVDSLRRAGRALAAERDAVRDTLRSTLSEASAVYYVIGTKERLADLGVVRSEGSRRFLLVGPRTLVPNRELDPAVFTAADMRDEIAIPMPDPRANYRVISRHDPSMLVSGTDADGAPDGTLRITNPARFWEVSRYLIVLQH